MFLSHDDAVFILVVVLVFLGELCGLRMIWIISRKHVVIFTISYLSASVLHMCIGISPTSLIISLHNLIYGMDLLTDRNLVNENSHMYFLMIASALVLNTIWCAIGWMVHYWDTINAMLIVISFPGEILQMDIIDHGLSSLLPYCPAILDIFDGAEMTETQLDPTNPAWVQIMICLAIVMFYISSFLEMYYLKFPEQTIERILQKRTFIQLVSSVVFLILRLILFARNPREFFLVVKTIIRVFSHYQMWSNPRRGRKVISVRATEISAEEASNFAKENLSMQACLASYSMFVGKADDETLLSDKVRDLITPV